MVERITDPPAASAGEGSIIIRPKCGRFSERNFMTTSLHFSTQAVHAGNDVPAPTGHPVAPSIYPAVTYTYDHMDDLSAALHENAGYSYSRYGSPTIAMLEKAVATLEGAADAVAYASGMGALHGVFAQANITPDRPVVAARNVYGATYTLLNKLYADSGALHFVEIT